MKFFSRYDRLLAMILVICMLAGTSACKQKKTTSQEISVTETTEAPTSESESKTTTESTTESTTEVTTTTESLVLPTLVPGESDLPSLTETSETSSAPTETTPAPVDPTKAPDKPKPTKAPKATSTPKPTTAPATSTPTATPTTKPTNTPTPTPTEAPKSKDPGLRKSTAISAAKAAVQDKCGSHEGFEFNDTVMANEQARADFCADNQTFYGHTNFPASFSSFIPLEACASLGGYVFDDGTEFYTWTDHSGVEHNYDNLYDCVYACAAHCVTQHTTKLSSDGLFKYYGIGFAGYKDQWVEDEYGIISYNYFLYIGGEDDIGRNDIGF